MNNDMTLLQVDSVLADAGFLEVTLRRITTANVGVQGGWDVKGVPSPWRRKGSHVIAVVGVGPTLCEALIGMMHRADLEFGPVSE